MRKTGKRLLVLLLSLLTAFSLCACSSGGGDNSTTSGTGDSGSQTSDSTAAGEDGADSEDEELLFGVITRSLSSAYFVTISEYMQEYAGDNVKFIVTSGEDDVTKQITDCEDMIQQGCDVIFIACCDSSAIKPALVECQDAGIPVVIYDSPADDADLVATTVASDNYNGGYLAGEALAEAIGYKGDIAEYIDLTSIVTADRVQGFRDAIAQYPDINIVNTQEGAGTSDSAVPVMENILQSTPDIVGLFAFNDPSANGCISAIAASGKTDQITVVSMDGIDLAFEAIIAGRQLGTSAQSPKLVAEYAIDAAMKILDGETVESEIVVPVEFVTIDNVYDWYSGESD